METTHDIGGGEVTAVTEPKAPLSPERAAIRRAADGEINERDAAAQEDALQALLKNVQDAEVEGGSVEQTLKVNLGTSTKPRIVMWTITNVQGRLIRKLTADAEEMARRQNPDSGAAAAAAGFEANKKIVVEGSVNPDLKAGAKRAGITDPTDFLEFALERKSGLIDQIAGHIYSLSGHDRDDVVTASAEETRAAGN